MGSYDQHLQAPPSVYQRPPTSYPPAALVAAPPAGYPMRDGAADPELQAPVETKSRGDGFWRGCCAALCCCCVLDMCF